MIGGIAGCWNRTGAPLNLAELERMLAGLGPQDAGRVSCLVEPHVGLGQMCLSLNPTWPREVGCLPRPQAAVWITASAFLLNRDELCQGFDIPPAERATTPDTHLILCAYEKWLEKCPEHLVGNFAYVIWDAARQQLFCARDHIGGHSLCYFLDRERFVFGTEVKAILAATGMRQVLNPVFMADYILHLSGDTESSCFADIQHLPPAHALLVTRDQHRMWQYWSPANSPNIRYARPEEYVEAADALLTEVLRGHVWSGESVGVQTGGGLGTAALASTLVPLLQEKNQRLLGVSYVLSPDYTGRATDERAYTDGLVQQLDFDLQYVTEDRFPPPFDEDIERKFYYQDSPNVNPFGSDHYVVYGALRDRGIKIALTSGMCTLGWHGSGYLAELLTSLAWPQFVQAVRQHRIGRPTALIQQALRESVRALAPERLVAIRHQLRSRYTAGQPRVLTDAFASDVDLPARLAQLRGSTARPFPVSAAGYQLAWIEARILGGKKYLSAQERRYGFSLRAPFMDKRLIEFSLGVPPEQHVFAGWPRSLVRRLLAGRVPDTIRLRLDRTSYPADIRDRSTTAQAAIVSAVKSIDAHDEVWGYINRQTVLGWLDDFGPRLHQPLTWRSPQPRTLVRVILVQRFLSWVRKAYGSRMDGG